MAAAVASFGRPPLVDRLLPWFRPSLTSRNVKTFIRCLVVLLATLVLLLETTALNAMGQAAFFACVLKQASSVARLELIVSLSEPIPFYRSLLVVMLTPNMPASLFCFVRRS